MEDDPDSPRFKRLEAAHARYEAEEKAEAEARAKAEAEAASRPKPEKAVPPRKRSAPRHKLWPKIFEHFDHEVEKNGRWPNAHAAAAIISKWAAGKITSDAVYDGILRWRPQWIALDS